MSDCQSEKWFGRRKILKTTGAGLGSFVYFGTVTGQEENNPKPSVTVEDQESDGTALVIGRIATNVDSHVIISNEKGDPIAGDDSWIPLNAGEVVVDVTIALDDVVRESQRFRVSLIEIDGSEVAYDDASVTVSEPPPNSTNTETPQQIDGMAVSRIEADPNSGFNYPYFLYAPETSAGDEPKPILVEPNNTGTTTDDFDEHLADAKRRVEGGTGRRMADKLDAPFLMPVLPRPRNDPVTGNHYIHQLDDTTMQIDGGPLERVDLQVRSMIEHAQELLAERSYPVMDEVMMNGYSASGNFVNRFTVLHPDIVKSVTAGGVNGMVTLPIAEDKGHTLNYHIGIANIEELTGEPFDLSSFVDVNQFIHMGEIDMNDTIPFGDAWTDDEMRQIAIDVYGDDMQDERLPYCKSIYDDVDASSVFRIYEGKGHTPRPAEEDMAEFHQRTLDDDSIDNIRADLGGNVPDPRARFRYTPDDPEVGEQIAFDAGRSEVWDQDIVDFNWDFGNGETATGERVTHTFDSHGGYNVELTVTDETNRRYKTASQILVNRDPDDLFRYLGVSGAVAGFGSLGYVVVQHLKGSKQQ